MQKMPYMNGTWSGRGGISFSRQNHRKCEGSRMASFATQCRLPCLGKSVNEHLVGVRQSKVA